MEYIVSLTYAQRMKESDLKVSKEKPAELARRTEKELFNLFQGVDSKYKNKYRSLMFNLRDTKNNVRAFSSPHPLCWDPIILL